MKKKNVSVLRNRGQNAHCFGNTQTEIYARNFGLSERRLLNQTAPPEKEPDTVAGAPSEGRKNTLAMLGAVHSLKDTGADVDDIPGSENPEDLLKDNPFQSFLDKRMESCKMADGNLSLNGIKNDRSKGMFTLNFSPGGAMSEFEIGGEAYIALMWKEIGPLVKERFARQITDQATLNALITKAAEVKKPNFMAMVRAMATSENPNQIDMKLVTDALTELQALHPDALARMRPGVEGSKARTDFKESEALSTEKAQFENIDKIRTLMDNLQTNMSANLIYWRMSITGRSRELNPGRWNFKSDSGIAEVKEHWNAMGIYDMTAGEFINNVIFENLKKSYDVDFLNKQPDFKKAIYNNPLDHISELDQLGDPVFKAAVEFFVKMQDVAKEHDEYRKNYTKVDQGFGEEPITATMGKALGDNWRTFTDALHNKDWTTAGAYVLGGWAMYRAYKSLPPDKQDKYGKWAFRGAALYAAHIFAKNAGFNILEKLGIKDLGYELDDTSLDVLYEVVPELKDVKPKVINATAKTNIGDLYKRYKETNAGGKRQWIDPANFRKEFPEFARMRPNNAFKDTPLNNKEKDYQDTGYQLYQLVKGLEAAYDRTMRTKETKNFMPFEKAILEHAVFSKSTVLDFTIALRNYRIDSDASIKLLGAYEISKLSKRLVRVFDGKDMGTPNLEGGMRVNGVIDGTIMNFPVVFVRNTKDKTFVIVRKHIYDESGGNFDRHGAGVLGEIPLEDVEVEEGLEDKKPISAKTEAAINAMRQKFMDIMVARTGVFRDHGGFLVNPHWVNARGRWEGQLSFKRTLPGGAIEQPIDVYITPTNDGKGLMVRSTDPSKSSILVNIQNLEDMEEVFGSLVLSQLVSQRSAGRKGVPDFTPLSWFNQNNKLLFKNRDPNDDIIEIKIGNVRIDGKEFIRIKMMPDGTFIFADKDMEDKLLKNPVFQSELSGAIAKVEFEDLTKQWNDTIEATPQDFLFHFAGLFPNIFRKGTWDYMTRGMEAKYLTGSVPKNFTRALVKAQMSAIQANFQLGMENADSLEKVDELRSTVMMGGKSGLENALKELQRLNNENEEGGKKFSEAEFYVVWENLIGATHKSMDYRGFYRAFMDKVFAYYGIDDFSEGDALKASRLLEVFSRYTAVADNHDMDGANLNFELRVTAAMKKNIEIISKLDTERKKAGQSPAAYSDIVAKFPPAAGGPPGVSSAMTQVEFDSARKVMPDYMKVLMYNRNASFCGEVANIILNQVKVKGKDWMPPGTGEHWGKMPDYESWRATMLNGSNELVDATPPLKMSADYMTFDKWLELSRTNPTEAAKYDEKSIYLPRIKAEFKLRKQPEKEMWEKVCTAHEDAVNNSKDPLMTDLEVVYRRRVQEIADKVRTEYDGKMGKAEVIRYAFDQEILKLLTINFDNNNAKPRTGTDAQGSYLEIETGPKHPKRITATTVIETTTMSYHIEQIEQTLSAGHRTMTRRDQDALIDAQIRQWFDENILRESVFRQYFEENSIPKAIGDWFKSVKRFLFGW